MPCALVSSERGVDTEPADSPFFEARQFPGRVPGVGRRPAPVRGANGFFGLGGRGPRQRVRCAGLPGRLQHVVFRTPNPEPLLAFLMDAGGLRAFGFEWRTTNRPSPRGSSAPTPNITPSRRSAHHGPPSITSRWRRTGGMNLRDWADSLRGAADPDLVGSRTPRTGQQPLPHDSGPGREPDRDLGGDGAHGLRRRPSGVWPLEERTLNLWGKRLDAKLTPGRTAPSVFARRAPGRSFFEWCPGPDSNRHGQGRRILSPLRLPDSATRAGEGSGRERPPGRQWRLRSESNRRTRLCRPRCMTTLPLSPRYGSLYRAIRPGPPCPGEADWSGKRDSNSRPQPWQGCALPTELFPHQGRILGRRGPTFKR